MFALMLKKEILDHIIGPRFIVIFIAGSVLIFGNILAGYLYYIKAKKDYHIAENVSQDILRQFSDTVRQFSEISDHTQQSGLIRSVPAPPSWSVHKPPSSLSIFVRGLEPVLGRSLSVAYAQTRGMEGSIAEDDHTQSIFPSFDLESTTRIIFSLFAIIFTFDAICGEKNRGTLRLIASFPISIVHLLFGKLIGALIPLLIAFGLPFVLGYIFLLNAPQVNTSDLLTVQLGLILLSIFLYILICLCFSLTVSGLVETPSTSFAILITFWVAGVIIWPRLSFAIADAFYPVPSLHQVQKEKENIGYTLLEEYDQARRTWVQYNRPRILPLDPLWRRTPEGQKEYQKARRIYDEAREINRQKLWETFRKKMDNIGQRLDEQFENLYEKTRRTAFYIGQLSPAFLFRKLTLKLAGTGIDSQEAFINQFRPYSKKAGEWIRKTSSENSLRQANPDKYGKIDVDMTQVPIFRFDLRWHLKNSFQTILDFTILLLWAILFWCLGFFALLRYDVR